MPKRKAPEPEIIGWEVLKTCRLPEELKSLNEYTHGFGPHSSSPRHWRDRQAWGMLLRATDGLGVPIHHGNEKRQVSIIRIIHAGQREWDTENMYGGTVKAICDALVDLEWLKDDNPFWRELNLMQLKYTVLNEKLMAIYKRQKFSTVVSVYRPVFAVAAAAAEEAGVP